MLPPKHLVVSLQRTMHTSPLRHKSAYSHLHKKEDQSSEAFSDTSERILPFSAAPQPVGGLADILAPPARGRSFTSLLVKAILAQVQPGGLLDVAGCMINLMSIDGELPLLTVPSGKL